MIRPLFLAAALAVTACVHRTAEATLPFIARVSPDSVDVPRGRAVVVRISGRGFSPGAAGENTIEFAGMRISKVPANDAGTEIELTIPEEIPSNGGAAPAALESGRYTVRIITPHGASNPVSLRVTR